MFLDWCDEGYCTLEKRRDMFYERRMIVEKQMEALEERWKSSYTNVGITTRLWKLAPKARQKIYHSTIYLKM